MTSLRAGAISEKAFEGGGGVGDPSAEPNPAEPVRLGQVQQKRGIPGRRKGLNSGPKGRTVKAGRREGWSPLSLKEGK